MPRFHFNVYDGVSVLDEDGTDLPDRQAARAEAMRFAGRLLEEADSPPHWGEHWRIEVTDAHGLMLFRLDIRLTDAPGLETAPIGRA